MLLEKVMERLKDKSSLVRKNALQLLGAVLSSNPFAAKVRGWTDGAYNYIGG